jgi:hypothetical protein
MIPWVPAVKVKLEEDTMQNWTMRPIGFVHSPFSQADQVPRGLGAKHEEEGWLEILPEFEAGLQDIDGFSHLYVLWIFDRSQGFELVGTPPCDDRPHRIELYAATADRASPDAAWQSFSVCPEHETQLRRYDEQLRTKGKNSRFRAGGGP